MKEVPLGCIVDVSRINFVFTTQSLGEKAIFQGSLCSFSLQKNHVENNEEITILYSHNKGIVTTRGQEVAILNVYAINGQLLFKKTFTNNLSFKVDYNGLILINVTTKDATVTKKAFSF